MKKNDYYTWLRRRTAPYHVGVKQPCWNHEKREYKVDAQGDYILEPRPINTNERILSVLVNHRGFLYKLKNADYMDHMEGGDTYYFQGQGQASVAETLVMIDIDCLKSRGLGSKNGAVLFAAHLKENFFTDLYYEPSTNGIGMHGYFVLNKLGLSAKTVNAQLRTVERWLKQEAKRASADIEGVEIKGTCPVFEWRDRKLVNVKAGTNAKLPRGDIRATTHIDITDLAKFMPVDEKVPGVRRGAVVSSSASWCPKAITQDQLDHMPRLREVVELLGLPSEKCSGRVAVTTEDVAIFLLLLRFFTNNMNENGTLPWARFEGFWKALYQAGDVERAFNPKRFAAIRNHLSSLSLDGEVLLDWQDESYGIGRACKWKASQKLLDMIEQEREETSSTETDLTVHEEYPRPRPSWQPRIEERRQMTVLFSQVRRIYDEKRRMAA